MRRHNRPITQLVGVQSVTEHVVDIVTLQDLNGLFVRALEASQTSDQLSSSLTQQTVCPGVLDALALPGRTIFWLILCSLILASRIHIRTYVIEILLLPSPDPSRLTWSFSHPLKNHVPQSPYCVLTVQDVHT